MRRTDELPVRQAGGANTGGQPYSRSDQAGSHTAYIPSRALHRERGKSRRGREGEKEERGWERVRGRGREWKVYERGRELSMNELTGAGPHS